MPRVPCLPRVRCRCRRVGDRRPAMPRARRRGPARRRRPPTRICRRRRASRRSPAAPLITVPRIAVPWIAVPRIGRMRSVLAPARTGPFGASVSTSRAAIRRPAIRRPRFFLTTALGTGPLSRDRIWLGLRRPSPTQVLEPLVVGIVPGAASAPIPITLVLPAYAALGLPSGLRVTGRSIRLTIVILVAGSPWFRDSLRNRGPSMLGQSLRGRPLIGVAVLIRCSPAVVLPGLRTTVFLWPGFVVRGIGRPLVLLGLRPS
jgi:hypothetical protein